jgi:glycosyltransferase involved in cell wall biosynthesis
MRKFPRISVAIPIFNEEAGLPELHRRLAAVLAELPGGPHEVVFADDGSHDGSCEWLEALARVDGQVKVVTLSRNFGHQAAITAALDHVTGDAVVIMDGDLQDTPETIPRFLDYYAQGYEVVYALRTDRKEGWLLRTSYALFYKLIARLADISLPQGAGDFAMLSRRVVKHMRLAPERHRYLRGLRTWVGFRQVGVPVERAARHAGDSKYSFRQLLRLACDGIFSFSVAPLRVVTLVGTGTVAASLIYAAFALYAKWFLGQSPAGFTTLVLAITFLSGVQLLSLGVIGEYVGRVYEEVKHRPHYVVDRVICQDDLDRNAAFSPTRDEIASILEQGTSVAQLT